MKNNKEVRDILINNGFVFTKENKYCCYYYNEKCNVECQVSKDLIELHCYSEEDNHNLSAFIDLTDYEVDICPVCALEQLLPNYLKKAYILSSDMSVIDALYNVVKLLDV